MVNRVQWEDATKHRRQGHYAASLEHRWTLWLSHIGVTQLPQGIGSCWKTVLVRISGFAKWLSWKLHLKLIALSCQDPSWAVLRWLRHFTHSLIKSCKQDSLQTNITLLVHRTGFSLLGYFTFQWTTYYNIACVLFLKQLCLNILILQFNFPPESTAVVFYQQIHSRTFWLATLTKTFFIQSRSLGGI